VAATGSRLKEWASLAAYALGFAAAFISPTLSVAIYVAIALVWLIPDRRFEQFR